MTNSRGILTIVYGKPAYASSAVAVARSLRLHNPSLPLAVATDLDPALFESAYDHVIPWRFERWKGWLAKFDAAEMSPFDHTLYLDTDMLVFRTLDPLFDAFSGSSFSTIGDNRENVVWFRSMELIRREIPSETYPSFNGGMYYFRKGAAAERVFAGAKALHVRYAELRLKRNRGMDCDQALFSLSMAQQGMRVLPPLIDGVLYDPIWPNGMRVETDVLTGRCVQIEDGVRRPRAMLHYYGDAADSYGYIRDVLRLESAFAHGDRRPRFEGLLRLRALIAWLSRPPHGLARLQAPLRNRLSRLRALAR